MCDQGSHGTATPYGQDNEDTKYMDQENVLPEVYSHRTTGLDQMFDAWSVIKLAQVLASECYSGWTTNTDRTSNTPQRPDDRAPPDDRCHPT